MWKNGSTASTRSSAVRSMFGTHCCTFATRLRWLSMTPLGMPVVPEEYGSTATWVAGSKLTSGAGLCSVSRSRRFGCPSAPSSTMRWSSAMPTAAAAALAWGSSGETVMSHVAPASFSCFSISPGVYIELIVVTVAPARRMPWNTVANAGTLGHRRPTTVSRPTPRAASAPAKADTWARRAPYVVSAGVVEAAEEVVEDRDVRDLDIRIRAVEHGVSFEPEALSPMRLGVGNYDTESYRTRPQRRWIRSGRARARARPGAARS